MFEKDKRNNSNVSQNSDLCRAENVFELEEYKRAKLQMQRRYGAIIRIPNNKIENVDIDNENEIHGQQRVEKILENENEYQTNSGTSIQDWMFNEMVVCGFENLERELREKDKTPEEVKARVESIDVYQQFLDSFKEKCRGPRNILGSNEHRKKESIKKSESSQIFNEEEKENFIERQQCQNNEFELVSSRQMYNVYEQGLPSELINYHLEYMNNFLFCPLLFPTKDGQLYYQNFNKHKKYSRQYSNKLYQYTRKTFNTFHANVKTKNKNNGNPKNQSKRYLDFFNTINRHVFEPNGKVKTLDLLCTTLHNQKLEVVGIENADLSFKHGIAVLLAIDLKAVQLLYMYGLFSKAVEIFKNDHLKANTKEDALDIIKKYEFDKYTKKLKKNQERINAECKINKMQILLSSCVQINEEINTDKKKSKLYKCCFLDDKQKFKFSESPLGLENNVRDATTENGNSLKFIERLQKIQDIGSKSSLNLILYKFCLSMLCNLKFLSCNYQCLTDLEGDALKTMSNHKVLECLQLFIEPPVNSNPFNEDVKVKIIPNETWIHCKRNCPKLRAHFIITGLQFDIAEKFVTKDIPLLSIHISSGAIMDNKQQLLPLLKMLMIQFPTILKAVFITLWKHNLSEDLDMAIISLFKSLKSLQVIEYAGAVNDLKRLVDNIVKVKQGCVKRIILKVNNHSKFVVNQVYTRYCSSFQSDSIAFTLVSLNI